MPDDFISLKALAAELGMDRSHFRRYVLFVESRLITNPLMEQAGVWLLPLFHGLDGADMPQGLLRQMMVVQSRRAQGRCL